MPFVDLLQSNAEVRQRRCQNRRLVVLKQNHIFVKCVDCGSSRADPGELIGAIAHTLKPTRVTLFTLILNISEKNIGDLKPFFASVILSQQYYGVYFISLTRTKLL